MYHTLNECIIHYTNVLYTEQMYYTLDEGIVHYINVLYTVRMYTLNKCIHSYSV